MGSNRVKELKTNLKYYFSGLFNLNLAKPYWIYISLSHRCNCDCQMCGVKKILTEYHLDRDLIKRALREISLWRSDCVLLLTGGEPFLRDDIFDIVDFAVSLGIRTEVVTNGSLINSPEMARRILNSGLQNIAVSLDGANPKTHDSIRGVEGTHERALESLRYLSSEKKTRNGGPQISVWTTIMKENVEELFDMIPLVKGLGVECLVYHPVIVNQADMQNTKPDAPFWISQEKLNVLKQQIDKIVVYQKEHGLVAFLHDPYLWLGYFQGTLTGKNWKCNPFVFMNIGPDGLVGNCGSIFGSFKEMPLERCLNTREARIGRKKMKRCLKPCLQTCWARPEADSLTRILRDFVLHPVPPSGGTGRIPLHGNPEKKETRAVKPWSFIFHR